MKERSALYFRIAIALAVLALPFFSDHRAWASPPEKPRKRILILFGQDKTLPANELIDGGIRSGISSDPTFDIELYTEYLDLTHFEEPEFSKILARFLGDKYGALEPDLIITVFPNALSFFLGYCRLAFPGAPIVACSVFESSAREVKQAGEKHRTTGVILEGDIGDFVPIARALRPGLRRIALVTGSSELDRRNQAVVRKALKPYEPGIEVLDMDGLALSQVIERVGSLPTDSVVLFLSIFVDGRGQRFIPRQALQMVSRAANVPVFGLYDSYLGHGIVGGRLLSFAAQGRKVAELAIRILAGESPKDIPFSGFDTVVSLFDWRELERWGMHESNLPADSTILFKEYSAWEKYSGWITGIATLFCFQTVLFGALIFNYRKSRRYQKDLKASELRYRTVADYTYNWEYWIGPDGQLRYISPACESISGHGKQKFMENPSLFREIVIPEDREVWDRHDHSTGTELEKREIQYRIQRSDGQIRWIEHSCRPVIDPQGAFLGIRASNRDITARKLAEEKAQEREEDFQKLTHRLIWGQEEEHRRLARELHDDLTQRLAAMAIRAGKMEQAVREGRPPIQKDFYDLRDQAVQISADVHSISRQIHPSILDDLGLEKAIESESTRFASWEGIDVAFTTENISGNIKKDVALSIYRIIQESFTNIAKHACARHVSVTLRGSASGIFLSIGDDGIGFDAAEVKRKPGLGLSSMRERVRIIRGELCIKSEPEKGTAIEVTVPLKNDHATLRETTS